MNPAPVTEAVYDGFKAQMEALGYKEGDNVRYVYGGPAGPTDALRKAAKALVDARVDLILAVTTPGADSAREVTTGTNIPVIFWGIRDPVAAGHVQDLQRPGGNLTGITVGVKGTPAEGRRLEWLKRIAPTIKRVYVPYNPTDALIQQSLTSVRDAAAELNLELLLKETRTAVDAQAAVEALPDEADAIFPLAALADRVLAPHYPQFAQLALQRRLPLSIPAGSAITDGVLMTFGPAYPAIGKQAARLADQIFKGAKPNDLPVEIPEFYLTINLKTADSIGLQIADDVLKQAGSIIR